MVGFDSIDVIAVSGAAAESAEVTEARRLVWHLRINPRKIQDNADALFGAADTLLKHLDAMAMAEYLGK
jgi:hypothetical protein